MERAQAAPGPGRVDPAPRLCFTQNTALPDIDFGSIHLWPNYWRLRTDEASTWIRDHILIARAGAPARPLVLGEFGTDQGAKASPFDQWLTTVDTYGGGALNWQTICDYPDGDSCRASSEGSYVGPLETLYPPAGAVSNVLCRHARVAGGAPLAPCP